MPRKQYDKYSVIRDTNHLMPFIKISVDSSDKYITWNSNRDRFDKLSQKYYKNPFYDFIILYGNPEYTSEFDIPDGSLIRIPFPIGRAIAEYEVLLKKIINE